MTEQEAAAKRPSIADAQNAVRAFLEGSLPDAQRVHVTKVGHGDSASSAWEAEADVWCPNATVASLNLQTQRPVLDHQRYLVRLDALLNVLAYELQTTTGGGS